MADVVGIDLGTTNSLILGALLDEVREHLDDLDAAPVIPRGTVVPVERARMVYTSHEDQEMAELPIAQGEHRRLALNTPLGELRVGPLPPSPASSPVEVTFRLDLSGVLHVAATHLPSGTSAAVEIANSPYQLTELRRAAAQAEVDALRAVASEGERDDGEATESDLSLARAMLARAERALGRAPRDGDAAALAWVRGAAAVLTEAVERRAPGTAALTDELSDALLDLV